MKNKFIILLTVVVLLFLYCLPMLLFRVQDENQKVMTVDNVYQISAEAHEIKLVNAIHLQNYMTMNGIVDDKDSYIYDLEDLLHKKEIMKQEIKKLYEFGIVEEDAFKNFEKIQTNEDYEIYEFNRLDTYSENYALKEKNYHIGSIMMDAETNKIISLSLPYKQKELDTQKLSYAYIQYLGLDILGDWKYDKNSYYSKKAQLRIIINSTLKNFAEDSFYSYNIQIIEYYPEYSEQSTQIREFS